ncbi:IPT/TIG domain-containing protein [Proteiniphilum sp. X52]|uniref:IPT/TIG domain-containing protein n=1 Tax=Proteiniphilum sp. X52 TaxID=2382159 RepID=UPI00210137E9|nr:IPT/TIG domain-containing protein [Proteiniphilum sp. X52]
MKRYVQFFSALLFIVFFLACNERNNDEKNPYDIPHTIGKPMVVQDISPKEGGLGTRVVVSGSNFGNNKEKVKLFFNKKEAFILKIQDNAIYAMVPKQPGELSTIKVVISEKKEPENPFQGIEAVLENIQFKYHLKASVTTVAGIAGVNTSQDGTALEGTFTRPAKVAVDNIGNTIMVSDDFGKKIRFISIKDNKVTSLLSGLNQPWSCIFNHDYSSFFVLERNTSIRPLLFYGFYKTTNWLDPKIFYDQKDELNNFLVGNKTCSGLTSGNNYVYLLTQDGARLFRIEQSSGMIELIGENMNLGNWAHITYNKKNGYIYACTEGGGQVFRFNPNHIPAGKSKPHITFRDTEHIAGSGKGSAIEGNGIYARFGGLEDITSDHEGNIYLADYTNSIIWKIDEDYNCTVLAGVPGSKGYKDGKPKEALFNSPYGLASTPDGIIYVADTFNYVIRCISIQ